MTLALRLDSSNVRRVKIDTRRSVMPCALVDQLQPRLDPVSDTDIGSNLQLERCDKSVYVEVCLYSLFQKQENYSR